MFLDHSGDADAISLLFENLQDKPLSQFHPRSPKKCADREGRATLFSDDFPHIRLSHSQLQVGFVDRKVAEVLDLKPEQIFSS